MKSLICDGCKYWNHPENPTVIYCDWLKDGRVKRLRRKDIPSLAECSQVVISANRVEFRVDEDTCDYEQLEQVFDQLGIQKIKRVDLPYFDMCSTIVNELVPKYKVNEVTGNFLTNLSISNPDIRYVELDFDHIGTYEDLQDVDQFLLSCSSPRITSLSRYNTVRWDLVNAVLSLWVEGEKLIEEYRMFCDFEDEELLDSMETFAATLKDKVSLKLLPQEYRLNRSDGKVLAVKKVLQSGQGCITMKAI